MFVELTCTPRPEVKGDYRNFVLSWGAESWGSFVNYYGWTLTGPEGYTKDQHTGSGLLESQQYRASATGRFSFYGDKAYRPYVPHGKFTMIAKVTNAAGDTLEFTRSMEC